MGDSPGTSRRNLLGRGALALGALAGTLGLGGAVQQARDGTLAAGMGAGKRAATVVLHGTNWRLQAHDLQLGAPPNRGDRVSVYGELARSAGGKVVGEFHATSIYLDTPLGPGPRSGAVMEIHNFQLDDGTLVGMGTAMRDEPGTFAIVGGTGRYLGATGSYTAEQSPADVGGDGTARFTMTITAEGLNGAS